MVIGHRQIGLSIDLKTLPVNRPVCREILVKDKAGAVPLVEHGVNVVGVARGIVIVGDNQIVIGADLKTFPIESVLGGPGLMGGELAAIPFEEFRGDRGGYIIRTVGDRQVGLSRDDKTLPVYSTVGE